MYFLTQGALSVPPQLDGAQSGAQCLSLSIAHCMRVYAKTTSTIAVGYFFLLMCFFSPMSPLLLKSFIDNGHIIRIKSIIYVRYLIVKREICSW